MALYQIPETLFTSGTSLPRHVSLEPYVLLQLAKTASASDSEKDPEASEAPARRPGRRISKQNIILRKFLREQECVRNQSPKLENIRYRVMRTLKKVLRRLAIGKPAGERGLLQFQYKSGPASVWYQKLCQFAAIHQRVIMRFAELSNGPKVDQSRMSNSSSFSTYNNPYMDFVFSTYEVRVIYRIFVQLLFADDSPSSLSQRFKILCCTGQTHKEECREKWAEFRTMMETYLGAKVRTGANERIPELEEDVQAA